MALHGRAGEARDFVVRNASGGGKFVRESAQAGAEHQRDFRPQLRFREDELRGAGAACELATRVVRRLAAGAHRSKIYLYIAEATNGAEFARERNTWLEGR